VLIEPVHKEGYLVDFHLVFSKGKNQRKGEYMHYSLAILPEAVVGWFLLQQSWRSCPCTWGGSALATQ
jgi:hypothetical protein